MKRLKNLAFVIVAFVFISCEQTNESVRLQGMVFGTSYSIIYYDNAKNYQNEVDDLFAKINQSLSTYIPDSDISKINKGNEGIVVDSYFAEVFNKASQIFKETNGYFDPTVGNLVNAWGFGPEKPLNKLSQKQIDSMMQFVGFQKVQLVNNKIEKQFPETYFDFNAIAKGYGIDVIGRFLETKGVKNYLVEIGGEVRCRGVKPDGKQWAIQLDNPNFDGTRSAYDVLTLSDISMASSGNYRKFRVNEEGEKFVHTINPKTGLAHESNLLAATVIANLDCANVDAYATAFMAMGLEKTKVFLKNHPELKVILIYAEDNGKLLEFRN